MKMYECLKNTYKENENINTKMLQRMVLKKVTEIPLKIEKEDHSFELSSELHRGKSVRHT